MLSPLCKLLEFAARDVQPVKQAKEGKCERKAATDLAATLDLKNQLLTQ